MQDEHVLPRRRERLRPPVCLVSTDRRRARPLSTDRAQAGLGRQPRLLRSMCHPLPQPWTEDAEAAARRLSFRRGRPRARASGRASIKLTLVPELLFASLAADNAAPFYRRLAEY